MIPHSFAQLPDYVIRIVPELRPAFETDIFHSNGRFKKNIFFQHCPGCNVKHSIQLNLPRVEKTDSKHIRAAKIIAYNEVSEYYKCLVHDGELYMSTNNIDFIISLNLN